MNYPLVFFEAFFKTNKLDQLRSGFLFPSSFDDSKEQYVVDEKKETRQSLYGHEPDGEMFPPEKFYNHLSNLIDTKIGLALTQIREIILAVEVKKNENIKKLKWIENDIEDYINIYYPIIDPDNKYPFIIEKLNRLKEEIINKGQITQLFKDDIVKLNWNGNRNTLIYIFKQLKNLKVPPDEKHFPSKTPFISDKDSTIGDFINQSFLLKGESIPKSTVVKNLGPEESRVPKTGGNRITLKVIQE